MEPMRGFGASCMQLQPRRNWASWSKEAIGMTTVAEQIKVGEALKPSRVVGVCSKMGE